MVKNTSPQGQWAYVLSPLAIPWTAKGTRSDYSRIVPPEGKHAFHPPLVSCGLHPLRVTPRIFTWITKNLRFPLLLGVVVGYFKICMLQSLFSKYLSIQFQIEGRRIKRINSATSSRTRMRAFPLESLSISISMIKHHHELSPKTIHPRTPKHLLTRVLKPQTFPEHRDLRRYGSMFRVFRKHQVYIGVLQTYTLHT